MRPLPRRSAARSLFSAAFIATVALGLGFAPPQSPQTSEAPDIEPLVAVGGLVFDPVLVTRVPYCDWTVVLDPGHGGTEFIGRSSPNNAFGQILLEKHLTLDVAKRAQRLLDARGYHVLLTRLVDKNVGLRDRTKFARAAQADVFVSIHFNGFHDDSVQGTETIRHTRASANSTALAKAIQRQAVGTTSLYNRGVRTTQQVGLDIVVVRPEQHQPHTAAALVEFSFLSDPEEEARLATVAYRDGLAASLDRAIASHLQQRQQTSGCTLPETNREWPAGYWELLVEDNATPQTRRAQAQQSEDIGG